MRKFILVLLSFICASYAQIHFTHRRGVARSNGINLCLSTNLTNGLVSCWNLDETNSASNRLDSISTNHLTPSSVPATNGIINSGAWFLGSVDQTLSRSGADSLRLSPTNTDFTVAVWAKFGVTNATQFILHKASATEWEYELAYLVSGDRVRWRLSGDGVNVTDLGATNATTPGTNVWHFYVAWHDSTNDIMGIQVDNGTADTRTYTNGIYSGGANFVVGGHFLAGQPANTNCVIDEIKYYNRLLTSDEKTELYNTGLGKTCCY